MATFQDLAQGLAQAEGSVLKVPSAVAASPEHQALATAVLEGRRPDLTPLVEPFDGGALVEVVFLEGTDTCLVAIAGPSGLLAAVTTDDQGEADSLYAHMAMQIGVLGERCEGCASPIPSVYQYCPDCV